MLSRRRFAVDIEGPTFNGIIYTRTQQEATDLAAWLCGWRNATPPNLVDHAISDTPWLGWRREWRRITGRLRRR